MTSNRALRGDARTIVRELGFLRDRWAAAGLPGEGLPHTQIHVLLELSHLGVARPSDLAERLVTDPATISRALRALTDLGYVHAVADPQDGRQRLVRLGAEGNAAVERIDAAADAQVEGALALLGDDDRAAVIRGFQAYARALVKARRQSELVLRPIRAEDDVYVAAIIRQVMPAFGADGPGFAIHDPEVRAMSAAYPGAGAGDGRARYVVVEDRGRVVGGGGFAPLTDGEPDVCELRKMYFLPEVRGLGIGRLLLDRLLAEAREAGFRRCYLETLTRMTRARALYEARGFTRLEAPLGATGHFGCDQWYARDLDGLGR